MNNPKRIRSKRKARRLERNRMIREPDRNFDPPEDVFETVEFEVDPDEAPEPEDKDCKYWENLN